MKLYAAGTQTAVISTEHTLTNPTAAGVYRLALDLTNLAGGTTPDVLEVYCQVQVESGGAYRKLDDGAWPFVFTGGLVVAPAWVSPAVPSPYGLKFLLKQTAGTGRAFPWHAVDLAKIDADALDATLDVYTLDAVYQGAPYGGQDLYAARVFKNGGRVTSGITSPVLTVRTRDQVLLVNAAAMTTAADHTLQYDADPAEQVGEGDLVEVIITATIDGAARTMSKWVRRNA